MDWVTKLTLSHPIMIMIMICVHANAGNNDMECKIPVSLLERLSNTFTLSYLLSLFLVPHSVPSASSEPSLFPQWRIFSTEHW